MRGGGRRERGREREGHCVSIHPGTPTEASPPSLTLRIPKDQIRGLSSGKTGQSSTKPSSKPGQVKPPSTEPSATSSRLHSKVTRSKAWLQDYLSSADPLKMYLAAVYDHTDPFGVCVAEVFHELPSAKVVTLHTPHSTISTFPIAVSGLPRVL